MGRKLEFIREDVVLRAMEVFWEKGYESTSLEDILSNTNLSKSSFYNSFQSKEAIFKECLLKYVGVLEVNVSELYREADSGKEFISGIFYDIIHDSKELNQKMGCFVMNSAMEFAQRDEEIAIIIKSAMEKIENVFFVALERSIEEGDVNKNSDAKSLSQYLLASFNGVKVLVKSGAEQSALDNIVDVILSNIFLKNIK